MGLQVDVLMDEWPTVRCGQIGDSSVRGKMIGCQRRLFTVPDTTHLKTGMSTSDLNTTKTAAGRVNCDPCHSCFETHHASDHDPRSTRILGKYQS